MGSLYITLILVQDVSGGQWIPSEGMRGVLASCLCSLSVASFLLFWGGDISESADESFGAGYILEKRFYALLVIE